MSKPIRYVAFLRGVNVSGHGLVKMTDLKSAFEAMGFEGVKTVLASGNVRFESVRSNRKTLTQEIETALASLKKDIRVIPRERDDLCVLAESDPFKGIKVTASIRLYVTFLAEPVKPKSIAVPFATPNQEFRILRVTPTEVCSVLDLSKGKGSPDVMNILEKEFGSRVTTRNWNTVLKVIA